MKKLFTSYYARTKLIPPDILQVSISIFNPRWWNPDKQKTEKAFAPSEKHFQKPDWAKFYKAKMEAMVEDGTLALIAKRIPDGSIMLCYEADPDKCHRSILAKYLNEHCDVECKEWIPPNVQAGLFGNTKK